MLIYAHALLKSSTPRALGWTWCLTLCAFPIGQPQGSSRKKNISEKVAEVRRERAVRVKNPWPVSARHKRRENTAGVIGCKRAEKKKGIKEERLLGDSPTSLPDLDHHQTLCILQTGPSHTCERTHIVTQGLPLRISQDLLWCCNKWTCMKKKTHQRFPFNYPDAFALGDRPGCITGMKFNALKNLLPSVVKSSQQRKSTGRHTTHLHRECAETLQHHDKALWMMHRWQSLRLPFLMVHCSAADRAFDCCYVSAIW